MHKKILLLPLSLMLLQACTEDISIENTQEIIRPVKSFVVSELNSESTASFPGIIESKNLKEISFVTSGRVTDLPIKEAMTIKTGDVIAKLDQRDLNNQLSKAEAQYQVAEDEYQRLSKLAKTGAVSKSSLQAQQTERDIAKVQLDIVREAIDDSVLRAPFDGVIAQTFIEKDQVVSAGQSIAILIGEGQLEASIDVPGKFLASLHRNAESELPLVTWVALDSQPRSRFAAHFKEATLVADPMTQTYGLTFAFSAPTDVLILPGMNVSVDITQQETETTSKLFIPIDAISSDINGTFVWLIDPTAQTVSKQPVTLNKQVGENIAVLEGLANGDIIVSAGVSQISEGSKVREWKSE